MNEYDCIDFAIEELQEISLVDDELTVDIILDKLESAESYIQMAKEALKEFLNPVIKMSLSELRDKGYIYKVIWNGLDTENTKIEDYWFTEEEAKKEFESLKQALGEEYDEDLCYIYNASDELDNQIDDEKSINENTM